jgi:hypothetical protein
MRRWKYAVGPSNNDPLCAQPAHENRQYEKNYVANAVPVPGSAAGLSSEGSDHASECLLSAGPRLLRRQRGKGMPDLHRLVIRIAKRCSMVTGGIHEGLGAQENRWDTTLFQGQDVVHTARHTRASISDRSDNKVAPFGQFVDDGWLRKARIDEFSMVHGL